MRVETGVTEHLVDAVDQLVGHGVFEAFGLFVHFRPVEPEGFDQEQFGQTVTAHDVGGGPPAFVRQTDAGIGLVFEQTTLFEGFHHGGDRARGHGQGLGDLAHADQALRSSGLAGPLLFEPDGFEVILDGGGGHGKAPGRLQYTPPGSSATTSQLTPSDASS